MISFYTSPDQTNGRKEFNFLHVAMQTCIFKSGSGYFGFFCTCPHSHGFPPTTYLRACNFSHGCMASRVAISSFWILPLYASWIYWWSFLNEKGSFANQHKLAQDLLTLEGKHFCHVWFVLKSLTPSLWKEVNFVENRGKSVKGPGRLRHCG